MKCTSLKIFKMSVIGWYRITGLEYSCKKNMNMWTEVNEWKGKKKQRARKTKGLTLFARTIMNDFSFVAWHYLTATKTEFDSKSRKGGGRVLQGIPRAVPSGRGRVRASCVGALLAWPFRRSAWTRTAGCPYSWWGLCEAHHKTAFALLPSCQITRESPLL